MGQCPGCRAWNTMVEEPVYDTPKSGQSRVGKIRRGAAAEPGTGHAVSLGEITSTQEKRVSTGFPEFDRVLGGGIVPGSLILVGGDPGIGKSTLLLQSAKALSASGNHVLYVSGEESLRQIKIRADRIGTFTGPLKLLCETNLDTVRDVIFREKPDIVIIDSIQTMYSPELQAAPGSVSQVREITGLLLRMAKESEITFFIIGHVTKEGTVAGPRVLEHMVDTVLFFEGDRYASYRILRGVKNRFGSTNEIGIFEMRREGLAEVENPSEFMLSGRPLGASGSVVTCSMEGTRPLLIEVQALTAETSFGFPKRQATGADYNRVSVLMAVLEKRLGIPMSRYDAYINLAGGIRQKEPALDLGIVIAILSSYRNIPVDDDLVAFGEVGLSGEIRNVSMAENRVQEAAKMGFHKCVLPKGSLAHGRKPEGMELVEVAGLTQVVNYLGER